MPYAILQNTVRNVSGKSAHAGFDCPLAWSWWLTLQQLYFTAHLRAPHRTWGTWLMLLSALDPTAFLGTQRGMCFCRKCLPLFLPRNSQRFWTGVPRTGWQRAGLTLGQLCSSSTERLFASGWVNMPSQVFLEVSVFFLCFKQPQRYLSMCFKLLGRSTQKWL